MYTLRHFNVWHVVVAASHTHLKIAASNILLKFVGLYFTIPVSYFNTILWLYLSLASVSKSTKNWLVPFQSEIITP